MSYRVKQYRMDMEDRSIAAASMLLGLALFLRMFYYFGLVGIDEIGAWQMISGLILPALVEIGLIVLLKGVRRNAPGLYGLIGAAYCLLLILQTFQYGSVVRTILAIIAYLICGGLIFVCSAGWLMKEIGVAFLTVTVLVRFFVFELSPYLLSFRLVELVIELAGLFALTAFICLVYALKEPRDQ